MAFSLWHNQTEELPGSSLEKLSFVDGQPKIYTEKDPLSEDAKPVPAGGSYKKVNWLKAGQWLSVACSGLLWLPVGLCMNC